MVSIPSANFFSLATTFSLPGITTYSVAKSFSTSTPRVLLGRSFTWPSDASTVKPLPRYFWMVFALAGDSTITKPLVNVSSVDYYAFCETSTNQKKSTSYGSESFHKILSRQLLHLARQLQFKQSGEYLGGRQCRLQPFHNFIDVGGFVRLEERKNLFFVGRQVGFPE